MLLASVAVYGLATAMFGISTIFALSYFLFALTGAGDTVSTVIRHTLRQMITPDRLRGRMTGVNMIFFMGGPQLGELEAGLVAALFGRTNRHLHRWHSDRLVNWVDCLEIPSAAEL